MTKKEGKMVPYTFTMHENLHEALKIMSRLRNQTMAAMLREIIHYSIDQLIDAIEVTAPKGAPDHVRKVYKAKEKQINKILDLLAKIEKSKI